MNISKKILDQTIDNIGQLHNLSIEQLSALVKAYPYFQTAHLLLAKKKIETLDKSKDNELLLEKVATYAVDRRVFFQLLKKEMPLANETTQQNLDFDHLDDEENYAELDVNYDDFEQREIDEKHNEQLATKNWTEDWKDAKENDLEENIEAIFFEPKADNSNIINKNKKLLWSEIRSLKPLYQKLLQRNQEEMERLITNDLQDDDYELPAITEIEETYTTDLQDFIAQKQEQLSEQDDDFSDEQEKRQAIKEQLEVGGYQEPEQEVIDDDEQAVINLIQQEALLFLNSPSNREEEVEQEWGYEEQNFPATEQKPIEVEEDYTASEPIQEGETEEEKGDKWADFMKQIAEYKRQKEAESPDFEDTEEQDEEFDDFDRSYEEENELLIEEFPNVLEESEIMEEKVYVNNPQPIIPLPFSQEDDISQFALNLDQASEADDLRIEEQATQSIARNENLLSEPMAQLLAQQGKTRRAIKIYQQLSLKYPEKKPYFADLIKKLKNQT